MHDQLVAGEGRVEEFELTQRPYGGQANHHLLGDRDTVAGDATKPVQCGEYCAIGFYRHEAVGRTLRREAHVLTHSTLAIRQGRESSSAGPITTARSASRRVMAPPAPFLHR